ERSFPIQFLIFLGALKIDDRAQNIYGLRLLLHMFTFEMCQKTKKSEMRLKPKGTSGRLPIAGFSKMTVCSLHPTIDQGQTVQVPHHLMCYLAKGKREPLLARLTTPHRHCRTAQRREVHPVQP